MPQVLCGMLNSRELCAASAGPPKGPVAQRVSAMRQGVTGMNCSPAGAVAAAVPVRATCCGELEWLSAILRVAARAPVAVGVKVTEMEQVDPGDSADPQVLVWLKSPAFAPPKETEIPERLSLPGLLSFTVSET